MITLINLLTGIAHIQIAPTQGLVNSDLLSENRQVKCLAPEADNLEISQVVSIPDLPELEPIEPESRPGEGEPPANGANSGDSSNGGGEVRSGGSTSRPRVTRPRGDDDDDDGPRRQRGDNDDDD